MIDAGIGLLSRQAENGHMLFKLRHQGPVNQRPVLRLPRFRRNKLGNHTIVTDRATRPQGFQIQRQRLFRLQDFFRPGTAHEKAVCLVVHPGQITDRLFLGLQLLRQRLQPPDIIIRRDARGAEQPDQNKHADQ